MTTYTITMQDVDAYLATKQDDDDTFQQFQHKMEVVNGKHFYFIIAKDMELMQFTGLLDKNGKDIYEGDIVIWDGGQYTVAFSEVEGSWILKDDRDDWECPSLYGVSSPAQSRIEIIGNIYEKPKVKT